jgi:uncharacterized paraquat-inducible protein A
MSLHLFSTPIQCTKCGTVVDDPTVDRCPTCDTLLKERRTPRRLAGVETRYGGLRVLLNALRFIGVLVVVLGGLVFFSTLGDDGLSGREGAITMVVSVLAAALLFSIAGHFVLMMDVEENTRSSFRMQQRMLEQLERAGLVAPAADAADEVAEAVEP